MKQKNFSMFNEYITKIDQNHQNHPEINDEQEYQPVYDED